MSMSVVDTLVHLERGIRERYDHLGCVDHENGAYVTGHVPHVAPYAYLCTRYAGLDEAGLREAEAESGRYIPQAYKELLGHMNGAHLLGVSLHGTIGGSVDRSGVGIGQPISIWYQNVVERPDYIPEGHLGIGAINGAWASQGHLYLTSTGEVELYNARFDMIGARWTSLAAFLSEEIPRRFSLYDEKGREHGKAKRLPGNTEDWERLAQEARNETNGQGFLERIMKPFRRN